MSAFVHDRDHIDLIVSAAVAVQAYIRRPDAEAPRGYRSVGLDTNQGQRLDETITATDLGRLLLAENVKSVRHLYDDVDETPEGVEYDLQVAEYRHDPVRLDDPALGAHWTVASLKALRSYTYQSCEHDGWATSQAKMWIDAITDLVVGHIPGYDDANTWSFTRPHMAGRV